MIKTAVFSGTFNPIHLGHLVLANYLCEFTEVEEVWLMVSPLNPLKEPDVAVDSKIRYEMTCLVVDDDRRLFASDFELNMPLPTYSIRTLTALRESYPDREFSLLIGADNWQVFHKWKEYRKILDEFSIWIYPRSGFDIDIPVELSSVKLLPAPLVEISSTFVRESVANGHNMRRFVPEIVWKYIQDNRLYGYSDSRE
ncbi:MAG: nadD [Bacteroidetes bacterium]|jgi:nicotinate-nucleotide adenylyltransferase|nr:nadD [Bacteroidota bacterium]